VFPEKQLDMAVVELIIGGVSLVTLISTFETAFKLYITLVDSTISAGNDSRLLGVKLFLEQQRFELYGEYVGIRRTKDGHLLAQLSTKSQDVVRTVLVEIETLLTDSTTLRNKYGIAKPGVEEARTATSQLDTQPQLSQTPATAEEPGNEIISHRSLTFPTPKLNYTRKVLWVWKDNKKVSQLHQHLRDLNDALWATLSLHHWSSLQKALPSFILPGLNDIEALSEIRNNAAAGGGPSIVADCAEMRRITRLSLREMERSDAWKQLKIQKEHVKLTAKCKGKQSNRSQGLLIKGTSSIQVIVEYKSTKPENQQAVKSRVQQLAFQLLQKHNSDVCLFQCEGFFEETFVPPRFGLILRMPDSPGSGIMSLDELLEDRKTLNQIDLGRRFALAQSLCYALLQWHASGWLHKSINTENIVFSTYESGGPILETPRLLGFGNSRPDEVSEESLMTLPTEGVIEWFRHPEYQVPARRKFHRSYDYYSLGVVLLAIGWWDTIENLAEKFVRKQPLDAKDPKRWAEFLVSRAETSLGASCGNIYRDVVLRCLRGDFGLDEDGNEITRDSTPGDWQKAFLFTVVRELARCVA
jgi:hypothetical protein